MIVRWIDIVGVRAALEHCGGWVEVETQEESENFRNAYDYICKLEASLKEAFDLDHASYEALREERDDLMKKNTNLRRLNKDKKEKLDLISMTLSRLTGE